MLRECTETEFEAYADFAYELALDPSKSGYPSYRDGIKTKQTFMERLHRAYERDDEQLLLFVRGAAVRGLIHYYWIPEDRYLQTNAFCIQEATEQALAEFLSFLGERFPGYELFMGFPAENQQAAAYLSGRGFECIEDDYNNTAFLDRLPPMPEASGVLPVKQENYELFRSLHSRIEGDMYWNSDRIYEKLDDWSILLKETDGIAQGAVYYRDLDDGWYEIFGIDIRGETEHPELFQELLCAAISDARRRGGRFMTFFCEKEYQQTALACGFVCVDNYLCFKTRLD